jgi:hypothetical protein
MTGGDAIAAIYKADLYKDGVLNRREVTKPNEDTISRLRKAAELAWKKHRQFPGQHEHKAEDYTERLWKNRTLLPLFRAKRSETLARLLQARKALNDCKFIPTVAGLGQLMASASGRRALEITVRGAKAEHVGIDMLDITICGAIPPYNPILGGKLVAMLMCSPEIGRAYTKRYGAKPSIIASSMAGHTVCRPPRLVFLGTTSLYGERLNQYHRVQLPAGTAGAKAAIRYMYLGESVGFGSSHLCRETVVELELFLAQSTRGRRVNSIFGEGVSPRLRKIRDGLDSLGLRSDLLLKHGSRRLVYGVPLATNFQKTLIGMADTPHYMLPQRNCFDITDSIAQYWCNRWLVPRLMNHPDVINSVATNDIRIPDRHAARVQLPEFAEEMLPLFYRIQKKGVHVFLAPDLHAKVLLCGNKVVVGSANLSQSSFKYRDEAALVTTDRAVVRSVRDWFEQRVSEPITPEWLSICAKAYRPPKPNGFGNGGRRARRTVRQRMGRAVWIVGLSPMEQFPESELPIQERGEAEAEKRVKDKKKYEVSSSRMVGCKGLVENARRGDSWIPVWKDGASHYAEEHGRVLGRKKFINKAGTLVTYFFVESARRPKKVGWGRFKQECRSTGLKLGHNVGYREISNPLQAARILKLVSKKTIRV